MTPAAACAALAIALIAAPAEPDDQTGTGAEADDPAPYVLVLGTAQDGGLPQVGCEAACCEEVRRDPTRRRLVISLLLVDPRDGARYLFEATPDLREQVERARGHGRLDPAPAEGVRPPLFRAVFLTHAHMGHCAGLVHLGREAYGSRDLALMAAPGMAGFLRENQPWRHAIETGTFRVVETPFDRPVVLKPDLRVTPIQVPHRDEFSDTAAFRIEGPRRALLFLPDIDKWERLDERGARIEDELARVDVALLDGTFFQDGEIPGRPMADIPHPFLEESIDRFAALPEAERAKIRFLHLNHTNPAADPGGAAAARVRDAGMAVAADLERHDL